MLCMLCTPDGHPAGNLDDNRDAKQKSADQS
jgi:hypothetical protein